MMNNKITELTNRVQSATHLTTSQQEELLTLLLEFIDCFALDVTELGDTELKVQHYHTIDTGNAPPVSSQGYRLSHHEQEFLYHHLQDLLNKGIIRKSTSPWVSPAILVSKKDGHGGKTDLRLVLNYKRVNAVTVKDTYPMPRASDVLDAMTGCQYFTTMDMLSGFWQMKLDESSIPKTCFTTPFGNYEWTRMPFGLCNAPASFNRLMASVLQSAINCKSFVDDVFVYSPTWNDHMQHLRGVLFRIKASGLKVKISKCNFAAHKAKALGFVVSADGVMADPDKIKAIAQLPMPKTIADVRSFLGMVGFYQQFISDFATKAVPLFRLLKKGVEFSTVWDEDCVQAFNTLVKAIIQAPVLQLPDWTKQFVLYTDWSKRAIGAALHQKDDNDTEHPIAFASRTLNPAEQNYAPTEGECLAVVWAVQKFRHYLHGQHFILRTDHKALTWLNHARFTNAKLERWALKLQEHSFDVEYVKGPDNVVADCLSRCCAAPAPLESTVLTAEGQWPVEAHKQKELDSVPCCVCGDHKGYDNIVLCDVCNRCFHLRCLIPPRSIAPTGSWVCPTCDPLFANQFEELRDPDNILESHPADPYLDADLLRHLHGDKTVWQDMTTAELKALSHKAAAYKWHPLLPDWLLVYKTTRLNGKQVAKWLVVPPVEFRWNIIMLVHDQAGHAGVYQTTHLLHLHFHWPHMKQDVKRFVSTCDACQRRARHIPEDPDLQRPDIHGPLQHVHVDLCGPFPLTQQVLPVLEAWRSATTSTPKTTGANPEPKAYVMLMVDYFTKALELAVIPNKAPATAARAFYDYWVNRYGAPAVVTSDNGAEFSSSDFTHMLSRLPTVHITTSVLHPASNGAVERIVRTVKDMLSKRINDHVEHWLQEIPTIRKAYMSRKHGATHCSPEEMLFGFELRRPQPAALLPMALHADVELQSHLQSIQDTLEERDARALQGIHHQFDTNVQAKRKKKQTDFATRDQRPISVGDLVLVHKDKTTALSHNVEGPFLVVAFANNNTSAVLATGATEMVPTRYFRRHLSLLHRYCAHHDVSL